MSHQPLGHGGFVLPRKVLLQGQDDAVGDDGGEDHVLKRSERLKSRSFCVRLNFPTSNELIINMPKQVCRVITVKQLCGRSS